MSLPIRLLKPQRELRSDRWTLWPVNSHFYSSNCFNSLAMSFLNDSVSNHFWQSRSLWSKITSSFVFYTFHTWLEYDICLWVRSVLMIQRGQKPQVCLQCAFDTVIVPLRKYRTNLASEAKQWSSNSLSRITILIAA